jgi:RNase P subunit RPR2
MTNYNPMPALDPVRALSNRKYLMLTASIYWRRFRKKLPMHFTCDCGWKHKWGHEQWDQIQTVICHDCGDFYRVYQNTIVQVIPNPLHRCLISDRDRGGISPSHPYNAAWS